MACRQRGLKCPTRDLICHLQIHTHSFGLGTEDDNEKQIPSPTHWLKTLPVVGGGLTGVRLWGGQVVPGHTVHSPAFSSPSPRQGSRWEAARTRGIPTPSLKPPAMSGSTCTACPRTRYLPACTGFVSECISNHQLVL